MCILCGDNVNLLKCVFYFYERDYKYCFLGFALMGCVWWLSHLQLVP